MSAERASDIAIIGMSAMFAGAPDLATYWQNIFDRVDAIAAGGDWIEPFYDPDSKENDRVYTNKGGWIRTFAQFNPMDFGIMPNAVEGGAPDQYLALKLARDAMKDAGYDQKPFNREKTGVIFGNGSYLNRGYGNIFQHGTVIDQTLDLLKQLAPHLDADTLGTLRQGLKENLPPFKAEMCPGLIPNNIAGRVANRLDLMGPNYILDAACASSLIAVKQGMDELLSGRCDLVIAGGINASLQPPTMMLFTQLGALSRSDVRPFDAEANGTLLGEGMGVVVLKRLADAERDGDRIYAVIKGIGIASDGKGLSSVAPRLEGETLALQRAYEESGIDPNTITLLEAHGTGIPLGDRTEVKAMTNVFGTRDGKLPRCALGSVKSMVSHCITASGAAGLIKAVLSLHHKVLPPTLCDQINPDLSLESTPFYINNATRPWIHGKTGHPRRAAVNAFGFGGINSHAIVEEYRGPSSTSQPLLHRHWPSELILLAATSRAELLQVVSDLLQFLTQNSEITLADLVYTLSQKSSVGDYRLAIATTDLTDLSQKLAFTLEKLADPHKTSLKTRSGVYYEEGRSPGQVAFLFPGEGGQYANMLLDLCLYFPQVRQWFDLLDQALDEGFLEASQPLPSAVVFPAPTALSEAERQHAESWLMGIEMGSATIFVAGMALYELLSSFGVQCDAMLGHSSGENTAMVASGRARYADKSQLIGVMNQLNRIIKDLEESDRLPKGVMVAVGGIDAQIVRDYVAHQAPGVEIAMDNCSNQVVLFGHPEAMQAVRSHLEAQGALCAQMPFDRACHTPKFAEVSAALREFYNTLDVQPGTIPLYSCMTTEPFPADPDAIRDWVAEQWSAKVRFRETIQKLYQQGFRAFVEVGSGGNLTSFVDDILRGQDYLAIASNNRHKPGLNHLQHLLGRLFVQGMAIQTAPFFENRELQRVDLQATSLPAKPPAPILDVSTPTLRLSPELAESLRAKLAGSVPGSNAGTIAIPTDSFAIAPTPNPQSPTPISQPPSPNPQPPTPNPQLPAPVLLSHFDLMQEFLDSQTRVLTNFQTLSSPTQNSALTTYAWPFLGQILLHDNHQLRARRSLNLQQDCFLQDHVFGGTLSQYQPDLHPLPLFPFTFSLEVIAEAAQYLVGGNAQVVSLHNLRAHRWLALEQGDLTLEIHAQKQPSSDRQSQSVQVSFYQLDHPDAEAGLLVFEGEVRLAEQLPAAPPPLNFALETPRPSTLDDSILYGTGMFHGPRLQGVRHLRQWSSNGILADLQVLPTHHFFSHTQSPRFQLDPGLLDAAGQLVTYWLVEQFGANDAACFPFHVSAIYQYTPPLPPGTSLLYHSQICFTSEQQITVNADVLDASGQVVIRIEGWKDIHYRGPQNNFNGCRFRPQTEFLSEPWMQVETGHISRLIRPFDDFLETSSGIWKRMLAHLMLNPTEKATWYELPQPRRTEWLLGRIAAKDAVRQWAQQSLGIALAPVDIEIGATEEGKPYAYSPVLGSVVIPDLSISHSQGYILAALATQPGTHLGLDLQCVATHAPELLNLALTAQEQAILEQVQRPEQRVLIALGMWCAKEAAAKATGLGFQGEPQKWEIVQYSPTFDQVIVAHAGYMFPVRIWYTAELVLAFCQV